MFIVSPRKNILSHTCLAAVPRILLIDNDRLFSADLSEYMEHNGYVVEVATSITEGLEKGANEFYDVVIINTQLNGGRGILLIESIENHNDIVKIAIVNDHTQTVPKIAALEAGANDCLCKPVNNRELLLRIRHQKKLKTGTEEPNVHPFVVSASRQEIHAPNGSRLKLKGYELQLMILLIENQNIVLSRDDISLAIYSLPWTYEDRRIDNLVASLRKHVEQDNDTPLYIKTVRNKGYVFVGRAVFNADH
jgi:two-component system, OmpR family, response regulator CpxR